MSIFVWHSVCTNWLRSENCLIGVNGVPSFPKHLAQVMQGTKKPRSKNSDNFQWTRRTIEMVVSSVTNKTYGPNSLTRFSVIIEMVDTQADFDYREINRLVKEALAKNALLEKEVALYSASKLRAAIIGTNKVEKLNSIVVLAKFLDVMGRSDELYRLFDGKLFKALFEVAANATCAPEALKAIIRVSLTFLSGVIPTTKTSNMYDPILMTATNNIPLIASFSAKIFDCDARTISNIVDFINKLLIRSADLNNDYLLTMVRSLKRANFFVSLTLVTDDSSLQLDPVQLKNISKAVKLAENLLRKTPINLNSAIHSEIVDGFFTVLNESLADSRNMAPAEACIKAGLTDQPREYVISNFSILTTMEFENFLMDNNMTFKKAYFEQLIFAKANSEFPLASVASAVSQMLGNVDNSERFKNINSKIYTTGDTLYYTCMVQALRIWRDSQAELEDFPIVMKLLDSLLSYGDSRLEEYGFGDMLESLNDVSYANIRKYQLQSNREQKELKFSKITAEFNTSIHGQAFDFVRENRFLQLSKGSWVYVEDPQINPQSKVYFIQLSYNSKSILYKEFKHKTSEKPNIDKDGAVIEISHITKFDQKPITQNQSYAAESKMISLFSRTFIEKISIWGKQNKPVLSFYTDTKDLSYVWSDGLKILAKKPGLSTDTEKQIEDLMKIRKQAQLLNITNVDADYFVKNESQTIDGLSLDESAFKKIASGLSYI